MSLRTPAGRTQFVLCAHVTGDEWYCHAGSFGAEGLTERGQLDDENLVVKDIAAEAWTDEKPAKRIRSHARTTQLRQLVDNSPGVWARLVSIATVLAEHKRAKADGRDVDWDIALAKFEHDPWLWKAVEGSLKPWTLTPRIVIRLIPKDSP